MNTLPEPNETAQIDGPREPRWQPLHEMIRWLTDAQHDQIERDFFDSLDRCIVCEAIGDSWEQTCDPKNGDLSCGIRWRQWRAKFFAEAIEELDRRGELVRPVEAEEPEPFDVM